MSDFDGRKSASLAALSSPTADKSPKGTLDAPILPLLETLNRHPSYYTTSSCSGRISLFSHPPHTPKGGSFVFVSHSPIVDPNSLISSIFGGDGDEGEVLSGDLVFRFEPMIVAVECRDWEFAGELVGVAVRAGFRESGIGSVGRGKGRVMVGIRSSVRMEVPLGKEGKKVMVSEEYVRFLVEVANEKMEENGRRGERLLEALRKSWGSIGNGGVDENGDGRGEGFGRGEDHEADGDAANGIAPNSDAKDADEERMRSGNVNGSLRD